MHNRREFIGGMAAVVSGTALRTAPRAVAQPRDRKPNLLFILADDHAGYVLGADGNKRARTPNLDRLASEGTRFARNYCNAPVCTPSRQCILTGQLPHSAGVTVLNTPLALDKPTLARHLDERGYQTAVFGKMHFNRPGTPGIHGFQTAWTEDIVNRTWEEKVGPMKPPPADIPTANPNGFAREPTWEAFARDLWNARKLPYPQMDAQMRSTWQADQAFQWLTEHKDDQFALWVSFQEPHCPFQFPIEDRNEFNPSDFPVPQLGPNDAAQVPICFSAYTPAEKQHIIASYYSSVSFMDRNVGRVMAKLHELGLDENTLVVYMADHGYSLGQHGRFEKHTCYEPALRVPLIMRWPGKIAKGVVTDFTESVDVPPTILDVLDAEPFAVQHGQSLQPYLHGERVSFPRQSIFSEYLENEEACIRTAQWKFVQCSGKRAREDGYSIAGDNTPGRYYRLFDLKTDPDEFYNIADKHPELVEQLSQEMLRVFRATHPEARLEPENLGYDDAIDWYLRPRDTRPSPSGTFIIGDPARVRRPRPRQESTKHEGPLG